MITSPQNPRIKELAGLHRARNRRQSGLTLAEGVRLSREALRDAEAVTLILSNSMDKDPGGEALIGLAERKGVEILRVSDRCYRKISGLRHPEGAAAVIRFRTAVFSELMTADCRLIVPAGIQDPGNAGAIVRTAEAAGAGGCILPGGVDPSHPAFLRAAAGSAFRLPLAGADLDQLIETAKKTGIRLLAAGGSEKGRDYRDADYRPPLAICLGSEGGGLPEAIEKAADELIRIPMSGNVESLNVAVAAGIILYCARKNWNSVAGAYCPD